MEPSLLSTKTFVTLPKVSLISFVLPFSKVMVCLKPLIILLKVKSEFSELGAKAEDIEKMAHTACYGDGRTGTLGAFVKLNEKDVIEIYKLMI